MKEDYNLWQRVIDDLKSAVEKAEIELIINKNLLKAAEKRQKCFSKPKLEDNPT